MNASFDHDWDVLKEWYSIHVHTGLPARIAWAANQLHITPSEFLEQSLERSLQQVQESSQTHAAPLVPSMSEPRELISA